jgi:polysaccharide chain length determinant protein (PEP-CTERM system associated)
MSPSPAGGIDIKDVIEVIERRKWWLILGTLVGLVLGVGVYLLIPPTYTANTKILVEPQGVPEAYVQATVTLEIETRLNTLRERVTSYANLNLLIDAIGPDRLDPSGKADREKLMNQIRGNLDVVFEGGGKSLVSVFELVYSSGDPEVAADVVREMSALFISENIKDRAAQASATADFLDRELTRLRREVSSQEEMIRQFRFERMGSLPSQLDTNLRELDRLNLALASSLEQQEATSQRLTLLRQQLDTSRSKVAPGLSEPGALSAALAASRIELRQAERIYTDEHPSVKRLRTEIADLNAKLIASPESAPAPTDASALNNPVLAEIQRNIDAAALELNGQRRQEAGIRERVAELQRRVDSTPEREQELQELTRDYNNLTETYRDLLSKKYEAALARNLEQAQQGERFKVLQPARTPSSPSWPDIRLIVPAGVGAGLVVVILMILVSEFRNPAFRSVERLTRALGLPVVASIPRIDNDQIYEEPPPEDLDPKLVVHTAPESAPAEQYRGFLPAFLDSENCRVVMVTSAARGDGKTLTCMNLALTLTSDLNKRVLVIDGDLRRPKVHRLVQVSRRKGLSNILMDKAKLSECALNSKIPRLSVLPAGPSVKNPLTLLTDARFLELLQEARRSYDVIMIDSPPLLPVVDTKILRKMADMVLFVVRADATPRDAVVRSLGELRDVTGIVFNQVSPGSFRRYYYYDAYSRYAYGDPTSEDEEDARNV